MVQSLLATETSELHRDLEQLEQKMLASIKTAGKQTIRTFKASIMADTFLALINCITHNKIDQLEKELTYLSTDLESGNPLSLENKPRPQGKPSYVKILNQDELLQLQYQFNI